MKNSDSITETDLHAYVDQQLSPDRKNAVEAWLAEHPDDAKRVRQWLLLNQSLIHSFENQPAEPTPEKLDPKVLLERAASVKIS